MKLIYRGVEYQEENSYLSTSLVKARRKEIIYRGNSLRGRINPNFPWFKYIQQFFPKSQVNRILDPITFWYNRKREFLQDYWCQDNVEKLELAWDLTLKIEIARDLKRKQKIKLKYRGVIYYH